jgi:hypothetical protein
MLTAVKSLQAAISGGEVGADVRGGEMFLLRRDALLVLIQVLERGCGWATLLCKGLELQVSDTLTGATVSNSLTGALCLTLSLEIQETSCVSICTYVPVKRVN